MVRVSFFLPVPDIHYVYYAFALLLLGFPRGWLRVGARVSAKPVRRASAARAERDPQAQALHPLQEATKARNWVDFFRALVGTIAIFYAVQRPAEPGLEDTIWAWLTLGPLVLGVAVQMIRMEGRLGLFAPIFFLQGLLLGACGPVVGLLSMVGAWALAPVLSGPAALLFVQGAAALILGFLQGTHAPVFIASMGGLMWMPALVSVLLRKRLSAGFDKKVKVVNRHARGE
jgi:hypothetical protein